MNRTIKFKFWDWDKRQMGTSGNGTGSTTFPSLAS